MRGLEGFSVCVLIFACLWTFCDAGPIAPFGTIDHNEDWAKQSGSFAASKLNVKWLRNTYARAKVRSINKYRFFSFFF